MPSGYGYEYADQIGMAVLKGMGIKPTRQKLLFFNAWTRAEGTKARYNPLATTRKGYQGATNFNDVGVKNFVGWNQGVQATIDTLNNGYYDNILRLLRTPDATARQLATAVAESPWGTGSGVLRVLGASPAEGYEQAYRTAQYGFKNVETEKSFIKERVTRFAPSEEYINFLQSQPHLAGVARFASGDQSFLETREVTTPTTSAAAPGEGGARTESTGGYTGGYKGKVYVLPTVWKADHVTDGLGWGTKSARDLFPGGPGTPVGAPVSGTIEYFHPTGAQGGGSMLLHGDDGYDYWLGHIDNGRTGRVERGDPIAIVSGDHRAPHVHIDRRRRKKGK